MKSMGHYFRVMDDLVSIDDGDDDDNDADDGVGKSALRQWVLARAGGGDSKTKIGGPAISFSTHPLPPSPPT